MLPVQTFGLGGGWVTLGSVTTTGCQPNEMGVFSGEHQQSTCLFVMLVRPHIVIYWKWNYLPTYWWSTKKGKSFLCWVQVFCLILDSSVGLSAGIQSAGDWVSETLRVRILHSAEEDNLSPFDSKIACLCQSIEINNNKYVYCLSQVRMPNGSGVRWAECLVIIEMGCWVQGFLLDPR